MALDFTKLDAFVASTPGAPLKSDLISEIKSNIQAAEASGGIGDANQLATPDMIYGMFGGHGSPETVQLVSEYDPRDLDDIPLFINIDFGSGTGSDDWSDLAGVGNVASSWTGTVDNLDGTWTYIFEVYNTGEAGMGFHAIPTFWIYEGA